jgi:tRNA U34 2-thiouridine synthase MnmA/TrmU
VISSRKSKAIGLFSGGLDSILATKLVTEQGIEAVALHFQVPFRAPGRPGDQAKLQRLAELVGASLISVPVEEDYLGLVRAPEYGYARGMAPCIDCIVYMVQRARDLAKQIHADFIFTGEVVGQRARCQNKRSLKVIEKATRTEGRLLRPLSAKLLDPTVPELTGLVRRERLLDLKGHGRRRQMRLAHEFGIIEYGVPTGGCMLIDRGYAARVRDAVDYDELLSDRLDILKSGRHFRLGSGVKVVVGRNESENALLEGIAGPEDVVCRPVEVMGPIAVLRGEELSDEDREMAARICARYCDGDSRKSVKVACGDKEKRVRRAPMKSLDEWRVVAVEKEEEEIDDD